MFSGVSGYCNDDLIVKWDSGYCKDDLIVQWELGVGDREYQSTTTYYTVSELVTVKDMETKPLPSHRDCSSLTTVPDPADSIGTPPTMNVGTLCIAAHSA